MSGERKAISDCDAFCREYIRNIGKIHSSERYSFLLGYYAHLLTDAAFQQFIRDAIRVKHMWKRIKDVPTLYEQAKGCSEDWDSAKRLIPRDVRMYEIYSMEAEYLRDNPDSGYLTEILPMDAFPDYIDYLPSGCIVRKIGVMGYVPQIDNELIAPVSMSREEFKAFADDTTALVLCKLKENNLS